jgi:glutathione S-transferase
VTLTLYDAPRCPYCARTRIVLAEKGVAYDVVTVDLDDRPRWIKEKNPPDGRVPVLEEDGVVIPESVVIDEFLEERYPEPPLLPADPSERAFARLLIERFSTNLGDPYYATRRGVAGAREELESSFAAVDDMLAHVPWLTGRAFGLADIAYLPWVLRAQHLFGVSYDGLPALDDWLSRALERAAVAAEAEIVSTLPRLV